jgi:hypothetical protein
VIREAEDAVFEEEDGFGLVLDTLYQYKLTVLLLLLLLSHDQDITTASLHSKVH